MTRRPWWWLPLATQHEGVRTVGESGEGRVLIVTMRDAAGEPIERAWVDPSIAWQWGDTQWSSSPGF